MEQRDTSHYWMTLEAHFRAFVQQAENPAVSGGDLIVVCGQFASPPNQGARQDLWRSYGAPHARKIVDRYHREHGVPPAIGGQRQYDAVRILYIVQQLWIEATDSAQDAERAAVAWNTNIDAVAEALRHCAPQRAQEARARWPMGKPFRLAVLVHNDGSCIPIEFWPEQATRGYSNWCATEQGIAYLFDFDPAKPGAEILELIARDIATWQVQARNEQRNG